MKNYRFMRAIKKYGWDAFQHIILAENLTVDEARDLEKELIDKWKLTDYNHGYNLREGADGTPCDEARARMSASRKGNKNGVGRVIPPDMRERISKTLKEYYMTHPNPQQGTHLSPERIAQLKARPFSAETREKMSKNHADVSGIKNPSARAVRQLTKDGKFIKEYPYATIAANELGLDLSAIIKVCRGKVKSHGGYRWEYV